MWSRRRDNSHWLGELTGPWCYRSGAEAHALDMFTLALAAGGTSALTTRSLAQ